MKDLFVTYELAKELEAAGFEEPCIGCYHDETPLVDHGFYDADKPGLGGEVVRMPIYQEVFDWVEERGLFIAWKRSDNGYVCIIDDFFDFMMYPVGEKDKLIVFNTKPQAWERTIRDALRILKEKNERRSANTYRKTGDDSQH